MQTLKRFLYITTSCVLLGACSLDEKLDDSLVRDEAILEPGDVNPETALEPIYNSLARATINQDQMTAMNLLTTDEMIPPVRGTDWYDFGLWTTLYTHQWDASHQQILDTWNSLHQGVTRANQAILSTDGTRKAQARFLRSYLIYNLIDLFGQVPFRDENDIDFLKPPAVKSRAEATEYIISELEATLPQLPVTEYGRPTQAAARALLAKIYINKFIFTGQQAAAPADMDKVISYVNAIETGGFTLAQGDEYFTANFGVHNENSPESIWAFPNNAGVNRSDGAGFGARLYATLHYNINPSGWNGYTTTPTFIAKWDQQNDLRFHGEPSAQMRKNSGLNFGFLIGQQRGPQNRNGDKVLDRDSNGDVILYNLTQRNGDPLIFTVDVPLTGATEAKGVRIIKYEPDFSKETPDGSFSGNVQQPGTDFPIFRWADMLLLRAEAYFRKGDAANAQADFDELRQNRVPTGPAITVSLDALINERGFELYWEGYRRNDLIRFGKFNDAWHAKPASEPFRTLFPIPQAALDANKQLQPNPGY